MGGLLQCEYGAQRYNRAAARAGGDVVISARSGSIRRQRVAHTARMQLPPTQMKLPPEILQWFGAELEAVYLRHPQVALPPAFITAVAALKTGHGTARDETTLKELIDFAIWGFGGDGLEVG